VPDQSVCDLWWAKWHCDEVSASVCFSFTLLVSSHCFLVLIYASDRRHMILPIDSVVDYIYQRHRIRFDSRAAFRAPRLWTKCHGVIVLPFWCHYSDTCHTVWRYALGHQRGDPW
jgi:hypothetical protein